MTTPTMDNLAPAPTDASRILKTAGATALLTIFGFFVWANLAPLSEGVPLPGQITVESKRQLVQHHTGGIVSRILVKDGQSVVMNQPLVQFDLTMNAGQRAMTQSALSGIEAQRDGIALRVPQREQQVRTLQQDVSKLEPLVAEELYPRSRYQEQKRQLEQLRIELSNDKAQLRAISAQIQEQRERLSVLDTEVARATVRAPAAGIVQGVSVNGPGAVVAPGSVIMEIIPNDDKLIMQAQVPPHLIEQVKVGLNAEVRFTALDPRKTPVIVGKVVQVSADVVNTQNPQVAPYYAARISVSADQRKLLGKATLTPGMPVEIIVLTGERSFMTYLFKPLSDRMAVSLMER